MKHRNSLESYELTRIGDKIMTERTKKAFCPKCGRDLGSKQLNISEHTVNLACPRCGQLIFFCNS